MGEAENNALEKDITQAKVTYSAVGFISLQSGDSHAQLESLASVNIWVCSRSYCCWQSGAFGTTECLLIF